MSNVIPFRPKSSNGALDGGTIHVMQLEDGRWEVLHETRTGSSWGSIAIFPLDQFDAAVRCGKAALSSKYRDCHFFVWSARHEPR